MHVLSICLMCMSYVYVLYACPMCMSYVHACDRQCKWCPPIDRSIGVCYIPMPNPKGVLCLSVSQACLGPETGMMPSLLLLTGFLSGRISFLLSSLPMPRRRPGCSWSMCYLVMGCPRGWCPIVTRDSHLSFGGRCLKLWAQR